MIKYKVDYPGLKVYNDRKHVGKIKVVQGGYQYYPKGSMTGGEVFKTMAEVKKSIEGE